MTGAAREQLGRLDDATLTLLASPGLLRRARKDLGRTPLQVLADGDELHARLGEHEVRIGAGGPGRASCTCAATGVCQHVLSVVLGVRDAATDPGGGEGPATPAPTAAAPAPPAPAGADLLTALLDVPAADLLAHAGRAGYRWAYDTVGDLDPTGSTDVEVGTGVSVTLRRPRLRGRYVGGPWQEMTVDAPELQAARSRVALVLALQRADGREPVEPVPVARTAAGGSGPGPTDAGRERLRRAAGDLVEDCVVLGLAHLSATVRERADTLATWAAPVGYHRLGRLLRTVADLVQQQLRRHAGADAERLLSTLAVTTALLEALEVAERDRAAGGGEVPGALLGVARGRYADVDQLRLLGLGAVPWRSGGGYTGLSLLFWAPSEHRFLTCTDARPEALAGFDPLARWTQPGPWTGLRSPAQAAGAVVTARRARLSGEGRLSAAESTTCTVLAWDGDVEAVGLPVVDDWGGLLREREQARRSLLSVPAAGADHVVLRPAASGPARFDPARQVLTWPLVDGSGTTLTVEVAHSRLTRAALAHLEGVGPRLPPGSLVVGRLQQRGGRTVLEPVSTVAPGTADVVSVHQAGPAAGGSGPAGATAGTPPRPPDRADGTAPGPPGRPGPEPPPVLPELAPLRAWSLRWAERGLSPAAATRSLQAWEPLHRAAVDAGITALPVADSSPGDGRAVARLLLRGHAVCLQYERLVEAPVEPVES